MTGLVRAAAVVLVLGLPVTVSANGWRARPTTSYYYAPSWQSYRVVYEAWPVYYFMPTPVCVPVAPVAPAPARLFAQPVPAAPSGAPAHKPSSSEPPLSPRPAVTESRSFFNAYVVATRDGDKPAGDRVAVNFWNLTERDLTLTIENRTLVLPRGKSSRLDLGRQFVWRVESRAPLNEQVPSGESALEIVIRR